MSATRKASFVILVIALLFVAVFAYDRGKKCGSWETRYAGAHTKQALAAKPLLCWRLH